MNYRQHRICCGLVHTHVYGSLGGGGCCFSDCERCVQEINNNPQGIIAQETVNHPLHYGGDTLYEVIKVLEAWGLNDFCLGNVIKYIARADKKGAELDDLRKARWYLDRAIQQREKV